MQSLKGAGLQNQITQQVHEQCSLFHSI